MKTLLQIEMYYVREYTPTSRFLKIINSTLTCPGADPGFVVRGGGGA